MLKKCFTCALHNMIWRIIEWTMKQCKHLKGINFFFSGFGGKRDSRGSQMFLKVQTNVLESSVSSVRTTSTGGRGSSAIKKDNFNNWTKRNNEINTFPSMNAWKRISRGKEKLYHRQEECFSSILHPQYLWVYPGLTQPFVLYQRKI